jgi:S1-C subfamily serine protease
MPRMKRGRRGRRIAGLFVTVLALGLALASGGLAAASPGAAASVPCRDSIPDLYERVSPAVVSIAATAFNPYDRSNPVERHGGSGVLFDPSGLLLTNAHVVVGHQAISVTLDDGTVLPAQIVGADPLFDIAIVRIPQPSSGALPFARLGDSDALRVGEEIYAIGNPFGLEQTLTRGIVSAVNRILPGATWSLREPLIQTDAAINPGNSGGPLINPCGEVVGITTAILPDAQSIGFAIPSSLVKSVMPDLMQKGRVVRPWLGVQGLLVSATLKDLLRAPLVDGLMVEVTEPGSPADQAGIRGGDLDITISGQPILLGGDIILEMNGAPVTDQQKLTKALQLLKVGSTVRLRLRRQQKTSEVDVVVAERPAWKADIPGRHRTFSTGGGGLEPQSGAAGSAKASF